MTKTTNRWTDTGVRYWMYRTAADDGPHLKIPVDVQRLGQSKIWSWKEKYDRGEGDRSERFETLSAACAAAAAHARNESK